jgi:sugar phosphate isomerase/epimerase
VETKKRLFELGTVTYNLARNWDLEQLIQRCEETGFSGVELRTTHRHGVEPSISDEQRTAVRRRFERTTVKLVCLGSACEFHSPDPEVVRQNIQLTNRFVELAADTGAMGVKVRPNGIPEGVAVETTLQQIGRALHEVGRTGEKNNVEIWLEVHGIQSSHPPLVKRMMEYCGHPMVGVTWNCNDSDLKNGQVKPYFDLLKPHIRNVHLKDLIAEYPYRELFRLLRDMEYDRYTLAEIPEVSGDPIRFMHYFRSLWDALSKAPTPLTGPEQHY